MTLEEAVVSRLTGAAVVRALAANRVHWGVRPQGTDLPAVVLTVVSEVRRQHLDGEDAMVETLVQADSLAGTPQEAALLDQAVWSALRSTAEVGTMLFWRASSEGRRSSVEQNQTDVVRRVSRDIRLRHTGN